MLAGMPVAGADRETTRDVQAGGADLVAVHSGGAGYAGWMQSAGVSVVADGSTSAEARLRLALDLDSGLGVLRHAVAGYPEAEQAVADSRSTTTPLLHIRTDQEEIR